MKSEIEIILEEGSSNKAQGTCFENLVRNLLFAHQYEIKSNINFTGMEIDLLAKHKVRKETLYVECKAKEKVSSTEIRTFAFNTNFKKADSGYFIRTKELEYQAGGLIEEMGEDERYKNLTFIEPNKVIEILEDANFICLPPKNRIPSNYNVTKRILCITYMGDFVIYILSLNTVIPTHFIVFDTKNVNNLIDNSIIDLLKSKVDEIQTLDKLDSQISDVVLVDIIHDECETISEVQESENWYDYLPASSRHFIGRDKIRTSIFDFLNSVLGKRTKRRVFYLTGKSGWGKSSLVAEIRGRSRNKHYKKRIYAYAADTRSATSQNFVALAFQELIKKARNDGFLENHLLTEPIHFTSSLDLLSSTSIKSVLDYLEKKNRLLVLIFDQFEDVFRKQGLFKSFYKFLSDITDLSSNIVVGFSWKTEILIPSENEAYHYWQQAKEQSEQFSVSEFGGKEIDGIIKQLEGSTGKLSQDLKRRIKESSQGLPWLTKKLCIHIYEQYQQGVKLDKLIDENLNIEELFRSDLEKINAEETSALKYIAQRAYDGAFFEITELGDKISEHIIESLRDKRLIIRSGANYNIYWDIFRDYLVTGQVPIIGESYILRQGVNLCLEVFLLFNDTASKFSLEQLVEKFPRKIEKTTLENILIELRSIGLINKIENDELYKVANNSISVNSKSFFLFVQNKFDNYTPYQKIIRLNSKSITKDDIIKILKETFKYDFQEKTWDSYAKTLSGWIQAFDNPAKNKIQSMPKGRRSKHSIAPKSEIFIRTSSTEFLRCFSELKANTKIKNIYERDLYILGFLLENGEYTELGHRLIKLDDTDALSLVKSKVVLLPKVILLNKIISELNSFNTEMVLNQLPNNFFGENVKITSQKIYLGKLLSWIR